MQLEPEQEELLSMLVEASRNVPREQREPFLALFIDDERNATINYKGLPNGTSSAYPGDIDILAHEGMLVVNVISQDAAFNFDIHPRGFAYYREMKERESEPLHSVEANVKHYLESGDFQKKYPKAHQKLKDAEALLWHSDSERQLTTIGHLCREALQEYATSLVEQYQLEDVDTDKAHDINRVKAVIDLHTVKIGNREREFLEAILAFWQTVSALAQRQEHGGQKSGSPLVWEDGRRIVFQTAIVMYEIDSSLAKVH